MTDVEMYHTFEGIGITDLLIKHSEPVETVDEIREANGAFQDDLVERCGLQNKPKKVEMEMRHMFSMLSGMRFARWHWGDGS